MLGLRKDDAADIARARNGVSCTRRRSASSVQGDAPGRESPVTLRYLIIDFPKVGGTFHTDFTSGVAVLTAQLCARQMLRMVL